MLATLQNGEHKDTHPLAFAAGCMGPNPNILNHRDAMRASDSSMFMDSMDEEMENLCANDIYDLIPRNEVPPGKTILRAIWSHRRKTKPDGEVYRHRSRICVDGSMQKEGIDFQETYSPVIKWSTIRTLFTLGRVLGWSSRKVDYVQAFPQATLNEGDEVYMKIPPGYHAGDATDKTEYVLRLKKNLYGLKQASYNWSELLKAGLTQLGFTQSEIDPCLYFKKDVICAIYVDDTIFWSPNESKIDSTISDLKALDFELTDERDVDSFLGVQIDTTKDGVVKMTQTGLIDTIIETLGLDENSTQHQTPAVSPPLHKHEDKEKFNEKWNYRSLIGMLTYLARNTRPDIEYAVHQCARFQSDPRKPHGNAIKRIGRYLLGTRTQGINFKPTKDLSQFE